MVEAAQGLGDSMKAVSCCACLVLFGVTCLSCFLFEVSSKGAWTGGGLVLYVGTV